MGWKTGVYCQQEHSHHDDTGSGAHPAHDVQLQCSHIQLSVVKGMYVLTPQYGTGAYFFVIWKQYAASDRAGHASRKVSVVLNFRPSRCKPLKAHPCNQFPIELLKGSVRKYYYSSPSSADVTNGWSHTFTSPYVFKMYYSGTTFLMHESDLQRISRTFRLKICAT